MLFFSGGSCFLFTFLFESRPIWDGWLGAVCSCESSNLSTITDFARAVAIIFWWSRLGKITFSRLGLLVALENEPIWLSLYSNSDYSLIIKSFLGEPSSLKKLFLAVSLSFAWAISFSLISYYMTVLFSLNNCSSRSWAIYDSTFTSLRSILS